jgi:hypothetical protein
MWRLVGMAVLACGAAPGTAFAATAEGPHEKVTLTWSTTVPGTPAGISFSGTYRDPANPTGPPPALRRVTITGPAGAVIDTSVPPRCLASDAQLEMSGESACPAGSKVGSGTIVGGPIGLPPQPQSVVVFNGDNQQIQLVKFGNGGSAVARGMISGSTEDTLVPTCLTGGQPPDGCPFDQTVLLSTTFAYPPLVVGGRPYFATPSTCPPSRVWRNLLTFTYADGAAETLALDLPCTHRAAHRHSH